MIPIIYEATETAFNNNGLGRLTDCLSCVCVEERNSIFEVDFEYPIDGANFDLIQCGRIIGVTHGETDDIQPFDIVSYSAPISGVVTFHAVHISYRLGGHVVYGSNINSLSAAFSMLGNMTPASQFTFTTDMSSSGFMAAADGKPKSVRQMLGGIDGSILDAYGGEYLFDKFSVQLLQNRGVLRDFSIRYGVNMLDYKNDTDYSETYSSAVPFWSNGGQTVIGSRVDLGASTYNERNICIPLDLSDKFESAPSASTLQSTALAIMQSRQTTLPKTTINVDFIRLQDFEEYEDFQSLLTCNLCDTIRVEFPRYGMSGNFKIVKTTFDVLRGKYQEMELGALSTTLSEALGINNSLGGSLGGGGGTDVSVTFGSMFETSFPYNATVSGIGIAWVNPQTTDPTYFAVSDNGTTIGRGNSWSGYAFSFEFPITAGHEYAIVDSGNVKSSALRVFPFKVE